MYLCYFVGRASYGIIISGQMQINMSSQHSSTTTVKSEVELIGQANKDSAP